MSNTTLSPNMNLPIPVVGVDPGPEWGNDLNSCLTFIDQHNHAPGSGVQINPSGLNINTDLPMGSNNLTIVRSVRFNAQNSPLALSTDLDCAYVSGVDLYFNDGNGNQVRITQSGGVAGSPGSIANLVSPASASYVGADETFVWQSDANTPANMDMASLILRNLVANSKGLTLAPPAAMGSNYTLTLPPAGTAAGNFVTIDTSGTMSSSVGVDNSTLQIATNVLQVKDAGIVTAKIADLAVTTAKINDLAVTTAKIADGAVTAAKLATPIALGVPKTWVNFNGVPLTGTYSRTGTLVTATVVAHGMTTGFLVNANFTSGTALDGTYSVTVTGVDSYTFNTVASGATSGNITQELYIRSQLNVASIDRISTGKYQINFTAAMTDANYAGVYGARNRITSSNANGVCSEDNAPAVRTTSALAITTNNSNVGFYDAEVISAVLLGN